MQMAAIKKNIFLIILSPFFLTCALTIIPF
jgi:hypothetical protein